MNKNQKIAFGVLAAIVGYQAFRLHQVTNMQADFVRRAGDVVDKLYQKMVDEKFEDIIDNNDM